jgi:hypothetical protein
MTDPDPLLATLAGLDPTAADPPPAPGSPRDRQILERAMSPSPSPSTTADRTDDERPPAPVVPVDHRIPRRTRRLLALAASGVAAAVLAVVAVTVVGTPGDRPDPVAALTEAAEATGAVDSLRVHATYVDEGGTRTLDADVDGRDSHLRSRHEPGHVDDEGHEEWTITIGDQQWSDEDPGPITVPDEYRNVPFPEASEAVVEAALRGAEVTDEGTEEVRGVETTHYRIDLGAAGVAALGALDANQVAMFELEYPEHVTSLDVWVADDLVRRISHTFEENGATGSATLDFYDIGAAVSIEPPG